MDINHMDGTFNFLGACADEAQRKKRAFLRGEEFLPPQGNVRGILDDYREEVASIPPPSQLQLVEICLETLDKDYLSRVKGLGQYMVPIIVTDLPNEIKAFKDALATNSLISYPFLEFALVDERGEWGTSGYLGHYMPKEVNNNRILLDLERPEVQEALAQGRIPFPVFKTLFEHAVKLCTMLWKDAAVHVPADADLHDMLADYEAHNPKTQYPNRAA